LRIHLSKINKIFPKHIIISGSKSQSNRLLILHSLYGNISIENLSNADDVILTKNALQSNKNIIDIDHAGTAMRFLTAYFSIQENKEIILTGSPRMKERPIGILVDVLRELGATIQYLEIENYPPLKITGKNLVGNTISIPASVSSQYVSALIMIAPKLKNGLKIILEQTITSKPYIQMSLIMLDKIGIQTSFVKNTIQIAPFVPNNKTMNFVVESDWSSASYFYSIVALSQIGTKISLSSFYKNSLQADSVLAEIYIFFGVFTSFNSDNTISLQKIQNSKSNFLKLNLSNSPDIAQTIAVTCLGSKVGCELNGLDTLKIKESDRLEALKKEIEKLGAKVKTTQNSLFMESTEQILESKTIATYQDHRMAMSFAPLAMKTNITIENPNVVSKSYPRFWDDLQKIGFCIQ